MTINGRTHEQLRIRPLTAADLHAMTSLVAGMSFSDQFRRFARVVRGRQPAQYARRSLARRGIVIGAFMDQKLVAIAEAVGRGRHDGRILEVSIMVASHAQGRGIGSTLLQNLITRAAHTGCEELWMSFQSDSAAMRRLVTRLAAEPAQGQCHRKPVTLLLDVAAIDGMLMTEARVPLDPTTAASGPLPTLDQY